MRDTIIIGGGLAGLVNAIQLSSAGLNVLLIERNEYPFHKVCGEYISNEVKPFLASIGAEVDTLNPSRIQRLSVSSPYGTILDTTLKMGAFGISRYTFDFHLYQLALAKGCHIQLNTQVQEVHFQEDYFIVKLSDGTTERSRLVLGAYGKRSTIDRQLNRPFFSQRSPYIGVKYHIKTDFARDRIALHNFKNGYCGISAIEKDLHCFCYLTTRENLRKYGSIPEMEKNILHKNPYLKELFLNAEFIYPKPEVINEISFAKKNTVENHVLFSGDTAGMIAPLCGNGMSMAIHSAKLLSDSILRHYKPAGFSRKALEAEYAQNWNASFSKRLWAGRKVQQVFGQEFVTDAVIRTLKVFPSITQWIVAQTHGHEF